jgi:hypothetical protein
VCSLDGIVCIGETLKNAVQLTFPKGARLKDPKKLLNASLDGGSVRAVDSLKAEGCRNPFALSKRCAAIGHSGRTFVTHSSDLWAY